MDLVAAIEHFYEEQSYQGNSPYTLKFYRNNFEHFLGDTGIHSLDEFNETAIRTWLISHRDLAPTTLRTYDRALRVLANWLHKRGYLDEHPMKRLPKPRKVKNPIVVFTSREIRAMLERAKGGCNPLRDSALIMLLLDTGMRRGEAASLTLQRLDWQQGQCHVTGKTGERDIPFGHRSKRSLKTYIDQERKAASPHTHELFLANTGLPLSVSSLTHHIQKLAKTAKVQSSKQGPHTFRHTFAVEFIRAGGDAFTLQELLGHTTLDMTRQYVHFASSDLRAAHKKFGPVDRLL